MKLIYTKTKNENTGTCNILISVLKSKVKCPTSFLIVSIKLDARLLAKHSVLLHNKRDLLLLTLSNYKYRKYICKRI